jgi:demethylmenaquinone methyltransferase/2-methoxy-6-polyprenyl-1,4-benzoquinol methylase
MSDDYGRSAELWRTGLDHVYRRFARALVGSAPATLRSLRVVDAGAGTGALSTELRAVGAEPIALDISPSMLGQARAGLDGLPMVAADALHLPLATQCADALLSAFLINHVPEPSLLLAEAARVVRRGGLVMAMTFAAGFDHPAKAAVDEVARGRGWQAPEWFEEQRRWAALTETPGGLADQAARAGLPAPGIRVIEVEAGPLTPRELVGWRLGHAHLAGFFIALSEESRDELLHEAEEAVGPGPQSLRRELLILSSRLPA